MMIRHLLALAGSASLLICQSFGDEGFDGSEIRERMKGILGRLAPLQSLNFEAWKKEADQTSTLINEIYYSEPRPEFTGISSSLQSRLDDLLLAGFRLAVERGDVEEAGKIFTQFGPCRMKVQLAEVLGECQNMDFLARIVHADLIPKNWSAQSREARLRGDQYKNTGTLKPLYYKVLGEEPDASVSHPFDGPVKDETLRPFRLRLEEKYPFLAEGAAGERPVPPTTTTEDPQRSLPDGSRTRPADPSGESPGQESRGFPVVPVVAGGALIVLLIVWLIGRALRRRG